MCADCSSYSGHSGICPQCRKKELENNLVSKSREVDELKWPIIGWTIFAIGLCWTIIGGIYGGVKAYNRASEKRDAEAEMVFLKKEIDKLNRALKQGRGTI
jgi:hypothetical protein